MTHPHDDPRVAEAPGVRAAVEGSDDPLVAVEKARELQGAAVSSSDHGRPAVAIRQLRAGLALLDTAEAVAEVTELRARLLVSLAWAESERGDTDLGLRLLDEAEQLMNPDQLGLLHAQRAALLRRRGHNEIALRYFDSAIVLLRERDQPLDLVKALSNRSLAHLDAGRVGQARADLRRSEQIATRHGMDLLLAVIHVNLAGIDVVAGDLPSALRRFAESRAEYERVAPSRLALVAIERAHALVAAGLFAAADRELAGAIEEAARHELTHQHADALQARAEAALLADRPVEAAAYARQAKAEFLGRANARRAALLSLIELRAEAAIGDPLAVADRARRLAPRLGALGLAERVAGLVAVRALAAGGQTVRAARLMGRYDGTARGDRLDTRLVRRLALAELAFAAGRRTEGLRQLRTGLTSVHKHRAQFGSLDVQTGASVHGRDLARVGLSEALAAGAVPAIYRWSERARAQALLLPSVKPPEDPAIATALEELRQTQYRLRSEELAGRPAAELRSRIDLLQRRIREHHWSAPGLRTAGPSLAGFTAVKEELGDAALVSYLRDGEVLRALIVVDGAASVVQLGSYAEAAESVLRLRADLDAQAGRALSPRMASSLKDATRSDAERLAAVVLDPLVPWIADRPLVVVPTGALVTVPWSVLTGRPVTVAPSATTWYAARTASRPSRGGVLLVAGPGNERGAAEVGEIARLYPGSSVLTGDAATPAATLDGLGTASVVHLAAHGHHQPENALFSRLDLAGGSLFGYDFQGSSPPGTVILSSCDLGLSDVLPGDETLGLSTALLAAGATTVIASVARVADQTAMEIMVRYHQNTLRGESPAAALASAAGGSSAFICLGGH